MGELDIGLPSEMGQKAANFDGVDTYIGNWVATHKTHFTLDTT